MVLTKLNPTPWWHTRAFALLATVTALVVPALFFLPQQSLWVDETTQLSGLTLGPFKVVEWLAGGKNTFDVPADRMPPLSYWVGMAWAYVFGLDQRSMRWLAVMLVGLAAAVVAETGRRAFGRGPGLVAGLLFALSPNIIEEAVNMRAYPLFLLTSSCAFYCFIRLLEDTQNPSRKWIAGMAACSVLAMYSHFYGVVLAGSLWMALLILVLWHRGRSRPVWLAMLVVVVSALGLIPFLRASVAMSGDETSRSYIYSVVRLFYRLFAHPAMAVSTIMVCAAALGSAILVACLLLSRKLPSPALGIFVALAAGIVTVVATGVVVRTFGSTSQEYNIWMIPGFCLLLAAGFAKSPEKLRPMSTAAVVLLLAANAYGAGQLMLNGTYFSHVRYPDLESMIKKLGPNQVAVIHDGGSSAWGGGYFPTLYTFGEAVPQYVYSQEASPAVRVRNLPSRDTLVDPTSINRRYLLVVRSCNQSASEIATQIHYGDKALGDGPVAQEIAASSRWRTVEHKLLIAFIAMDIDVFERAD